MFKFQTSVIHILKKGLSYRHFSSMKRNISYCSSHSLLKLAAYNINSCCWISGSKKCNVRNDKKLHTRIISDKDIEDDKILSESIEDLAEEDDFGINVKLDYCQQKGKKKRSCINHHDYNNGRFWEKMGMEESVLPHELINDLSVRRKLKTGWQNTFGTLSPEKQENYHKEEEDMRLHMRLAKKGRRNEPYWYSKKIKEFGKKGKVKEAIEVFDLWMQRNDRVMPNKYVISHLLTVLANAGYTKKAFEVFNQGKKLGIEPNNYMYSALLNACANSPWPEEGLARAILVLEDMAFRNITPNSVTYNSMMKAFAFCGDAKTAFLVADKYTDNQKLDAEAFSHILMASIADKQAGFWYAVQVWRWMLIKGIKPTIQLYNLLLRAVKECDISDSILSQHLLLPINPARTMKLFKKENSKRLHEFETLQKSDALSYIDCEPLIQSQSNCMKVPSEVTGYTDLPLLENKKGFEICDDSNKTKKQNTLSQFSGESTRLPNILNPNEDLSHVISVTYVSTPEERFVMVGGMTGFLSDMEKNGVKPSLETFDQMLSLIPPDSEQELLDLMDKKGVKPDIDLLTNLAYRRCCRFDYLLAKNVLELVTFYKLIPNMRMYSVLAMTCNTLYDGIQLIRNMKAASVVPNIKVIGALLRSSNIDFKYKKFLLKEMEESGILPDQKFIHSIEFQISKARQLILKMEREKRDNTRGFRKLDMDFEDFKQFYQSWLQRMNLDVPEHPWAPFREKKKTDTQNN